MRTMIEALAILAVVALAIWLLSTTIVESETMQTILQTLTVPR